MVEDVHRARHKLAILNDDEQSDKDNVSEDEDSEAEDGVQEDLSDLHQFRSEKGFMINKRVLPPITLGRGHYIVVSRVTVSESGYRHKDNDNYKYNYNDNDNYSD